MKIPACKSGTDKSAWAWCKVVYDVESEMTQPAKVQEPSMEEILASIRRIIADDEAKPAAAGEAAGWRKAAPRRSRVMKDIPPSAIAAGARPPPSLRRRPSRHHPRRDGRKQ